MCINQWLKVSKQLRSVSKAAMFYLCPAGRTPSSKQHADHYATPRGAENRPEHIAATRSLSKAMRQVDLKQFQPEENFKKLACGNAWNISR